MFRPRLLHIASLLMPDMVWEMEDKEAAYLTFDDGPTPGITEWILDELDRYGAKATFFCLGRNIEMYPELYARIVAAGHKVGNHTYSHLRGWGVRLWEYLEDVDFANRTVGSDLFRPPYARISRRQAKILRQRYTLVMGSVVSRDYNQSLSPEKCLRNVTEYVRGGSIIVFHDSAKAEANLKYALPRTLEHINRMGLKFKTLEFDKK